MFETPLVEVAKIFVDRFAIPVIVLQDFCAMNGKITLETPG